MVNVRALVFLFFFLTTPVLPAVTGNLPGTISSSASASASAPVPPVFNIEGSYSGMMHLTDGFVRTIPLSLSLTFTGQTTTATQGSTTVEYPVIDGAFVVDNEGGPYSFSNVTFKIDKSEFDLRYDRQQLTLNRNLPAAFRLVGKLDGKGGIQGRVLSGLHGKIGTFSVQQNRDPSLLTQTKYNCAWYGAATIVPDGTRVPFFLEIADGQTTLTNPPNLEFDWTPGKTATYSWNGTQSTFTGVSIDYLRRHISLALSSPGSGVPNELDIEADIDFEENTLIGTFNSKFGGRRATLKLRKIR